MGNKGCYVIKSVGKLGSVYPCDVSHHSNCIVTDKQDPFNDILNCKLHCRKAL